VHLARRNSYPYPLSALSTCSIRTQKPLRPSLFFASYFIVSLRNPFYPFHLAPTISPAPAPVTSPPPPSPSTPPISNQPLLTLPLSGNPVHCYYCPNCTTHVYHHQTVMGPKVVVRTVLLDGGKDWKPHAEIYGKAKMNWEKEVAHTFETLPPS